MDEAITNFAARLKELRERAGLTQRQLAEKAKVGLGSLRHWEQGSRQPSFAAAVALADAMETSCTTFLQPVGRRPPGPQRAEPDPHASRRDRIRAGIRARSQWSFLASNTRPGHFAARLRELRRAAGLTQAELAERAGLSCVAVSHLEQATREPAFATAVVLAKALGTNCLAFTVSRNPE